MQGVRTTRGCISCRRRKKGCDFRTPSCGRCQRLNVTCRYEEQNWTFVDQGNELSRPVSPRVPVGALQNSLAQTDSFLQTDAEFWDLFLPREDGSLDGSIGGVLAAPWLPTVRALAVDSDNVRITLQACVFAGLGWMREDLTLVEYAGGLYAQALRVTNAALQDPNYVLEDDVLACCRLLSLFEMFRRRETLSAARQRNQVRDWGSHVAGTSRIVELRGRQRHLSGHGLHLYDGVRMTAVISGLAQRRPNEFTLLAWNLPRRTLRDELFDLAGLIPSRLQQMDVLRAEIESIDNEGRALLMRRGEEVIEQCLAICHNLHEWEKRALETCNDNGAAESASLSSGIVSVRDSHSPLVAVCTLFGFGFFAICAQYWAICTTFYSSIQNLSQLLSSVPTATPQSKIVQLPQWVDGESHALNIAYTAEYFFRPEAGLWSAQSAVFPVGTALSYFARTGRRECPPFQIMIAAFQYNKLGTIMRDFLYSISM